MNLLEERCLIKADQLIKLGYSNLDLFQLTDLLIKLETEKLEKDELSDKGINYNDEILKIEDCGIKETIDISVSGDNLFYCNGILTKNSFGLPHTADLMFAIISTEELESMGQLMIKQLKNRYKEESYYRRFTVGIDRSKMRLYDLEDSAQTELYDESSLHSSDDNSLDSNKKSKFGDWNYG